MEQNLLGSFSSRSTHRICGPERATELGQPGSIGFETIKGLWGAAEAWHGVVWPESLKEGQERPLGKMQWKV